MRKTLLLAIIISLMLFPVAGAIIKEDWSKYTKADKDDGSGNNVTLNWLKRNYTNNEENYTVTVRDFDTQGVALDVLYNGRKETAIFSGEWNANRTEIISTEPAELYNKTMRITPIRIVPRAGVFTCCPEAEININLLRPKINLEFNEDTKTNAYRMYEEIPIELTVTNEGDAEITSTVVYIDTDGLEFEYGYPYYQLFTLSGNEQTNLTGITNQTINLRLKFPEPPEKLNYTIHAYVKGEKGETTYYNDATKTISLLPSVSLSKSVTEESMILSRKDLDSIYPSTDADNISRWPEGIYVTLGVTNDQNYEIRGIMLSDALNKQFAIENNSLNWIFDLKPLETKEFRYMLKAKRPGSFTLPAALLTYSEFNLSWSELSDTPSTEVHGPCVQVSKKSDKPVLAPGKNITITLNIRNSGDMSSKVRVVDVLPENFTFLGGQMNYSGIVVPKGSAVISYNISTNKEDQVQLLNPMIYVNGGESMDCGEPVSGKILVKEPSRPAIPTLAKSIQIPAETPTATPVPLTQKYSWLEGLIPALMLVLSVVALLVLHRSNR